MTHSLRTIVLEVVSYLLIWRASFSFLLTSWKYLLVYPIISKWMCLLIRIFQENRINSVWGGYGKIFIMNHEIRYWEDKLFTCKLGKQWGSQANSKSKGDGSDNLRPSPSLKTQDSETPKPLAEELDLGRNLTYFHLFSALLLPTRNKLMSTRIGLVSLHSLQGPSPPQHCTGSISQADIWITNHYR